MDGNKVTRIALAVENFSVRDQKDDVFELVFDDEDKLKIDPELFWLVKVELKLICSELVPAFSTMYDSLPIKANLLSSLGHFNKSKAVY